MLQLGSFVLSAGHDPSRRQVETMMRIIARRCGPLRFDALPAGAPPTRCGRSDSSALPPTALPTMPNKPDDVL